MGFPLPSYRTVPHSSSAGTRSLMRTAYSSSEITQLSLAADLVTLSACDMATGRPEGEEGIDGLVEPFLLAGAKSVLGALWEVDDSAARQFMTIFYTQLARREDEASALRQAKLEYLEKMGDRPPVYWAPFSPGRGRL